MIYEPSWLYEGGFQFKKHYFGKPGELIEKTPAGHQTEEFKCAQFLDNLQEVKYWVRNLSRKLSVANIIDVKFADSDQLIRGFGGKHHQLA
jgi:type III restriction enzyme